MRSWESIGWYRHAFELQGIAGSQAEAIQQQIAEIRNWESSGGKEQLATAQMSRLVGFDIGEVLIARSRFVDGGESCRRRNVGIPKPLSNLMRSPRGSV